MLKKELIKNGIKISLILLIAIFFTYKIYYHFQNDRTKVMESISSGYEIKKKHFGLFKYENK